MQTFIAVKGCQILLLGNLFLFHVSAIGVNVNGRGNVDPISISGWNGNFRDFNLNCGGNASMGFPVCDPFPEIDFANLWLIFYYGDSHSVSVDLTLAEECPRAVGMISLGESLLVVQKINFPAGVPQTLSAEILVEYHHPCDILMLLRFTVFCNDILVACAEIDAKVKSRTE